MAVSVHSPMPTRCPGGKSPRAVLGPPRLRALLALGASVCLLGCASGGHHVRASSSLVAGKRAGPIPAAQLAPAADLAERFASAYARSIYLPRPPRLPGATSGVQRQLREAARRVPPARRGRHPHLASLRLELKAAGVLAASVAIDDGHGPVFSVGFNVQRRGSRWWVVAISPPG